MKKKVIIHGATNTSNFGDILFAYLFFEECIKQNLDPYFLQLPIYGIGEFCKKELKYQKKMPIIKSLKADALILMSGGYLGDDKVTIKNTIKRYVRYIMWPRMFQIIGKPVYVLGVGGGPIISKYLKKSIVQLLNNAEIVAVRDIETQRYFYDYGVVKSIDVTSDTAQIIQKTNLPVLNNDISKQINEKLAGKKILFLHLVADRKKDEMIKDKIIPAVNRFISKFPEYGVVAGMDSVCKANISDFESFRGIKTSFKYVYNYKESLQLCALLNLCNFVITTKLHVGIVSSALSKSVVAFPTHREKVQRYYKQIGEIDRCVQLLNVTQNEVLDLMCKFHDKPICLSANIVNSANKNLEYIKVIDTRGV